jgi:hypothetical protein
MARRAGIHELAEADVIELALTRSEVMRPRGFARPDPSPELIELDLIEADLIEADDDTTTIESH